MSTPRPRHRFDPGSPRATLALAMSVAFGAIAVLVGRILGVGAMDEGQLVLLVLSACGAGAPTTYLALAWVRRRRDDGGSLVALALGVFVGAILGTVSQVYLALRLPPWEKLWILGIPLGSDRATWIASGAILGALGGLGAFVALAIGMRALRDLPRVLDAEEKLGVPALAIATATASCLPLLLEPHEVIPALAVAGLGIAGLVVLARRDVARRAFVTRVFDGAEPGYALVPLDGGDHAPRLAALSDVGWAELLVVETTEEGYRVPARGAELALLAGTKEESNAPIERRLRIATTALVASFALCLLRVVALALAGR